MMATGFSAEILDRPEPLAPVWTRLEAAGHLTAFQASAWALPWYRLAVAEGIAPRIIVLRDDGDAVVGLLPLALRRQGGSRVVDIAGLDLSDYAAPVLDRSDRIPDAVALSLLENALDRLDADRVVLRNMPPLIGGRANPLARLAGVRPSRMPAVGLDLAGDDPLPRDRRRDIERLRRKLARERGEARLMLPDTAAEATLLFDALVARRIARFDALGRDDVFRDHLSHTFYREVFTADPGRGFARVVGLQVNGETVAADLCLCHGGQMLVLAGAFRDDDAFRPYGLGNLLTVAELDLARAEGLSRLDLTIGAEDYKFRLGGEGQALFELVRPLTLSGRVAWADWRLRDEVRGRPQLRRRLGGLRAGLQGLAARTPPHAGKVASAALLFAVGEYMEVFG